MPTPAERKALLYLTGLLCLGATVRAAGSVRVEPPPAESRGALARQIDAVDSARRAGKQQGRARRVAGAAREAPAARQARPERPTLPARPTRPARPRANSRLAPADSTVPIDLDAASATVLESLPRIGPALARRIVEDRERRGPFGSLEGFQRVRGVGPGVARELARRVTFSGAQRLSRAAFPPLGGARATVAP